MRFFYLFLLAYYKSKYDDDITTRSAKIHLVCLILSQKYEYQKKFINMLVWYYIRKKKFTMVQLNTLKAMNA